MVESINRPEANLTGASFYSGGAIIAKQLELLRQLVPKIAVVAMLVHPSSTSAEPQMQDAVVAARQNGVALHFVKIADAPDIDAAFTAIQADALVIAVDPFFDSRATQIVAGSARRRLPTMYYIREFVEAGGLVSYGASILETYRQAGVYARPHSRWCQAGRIAGRAADQIRVGHQPQRPRRGLGSRFLRHCWRPPMT